MSRITLRLAVATLTFVASLAAVWFVGLLPRAESLIADLIAPAPKVALEIAAPSIPDEDDEASAVYAVLIHETLVSGETEQVVIEAETKGSFMYEDGAARGGFYPYGSFEKLLQNTMPAASPETLVDYVWKTKSPRRLSHIDGLKIRAVFLDEDELQALFPQHGFGTEWKRFYAKYPNSSGIISFSRVGFNRQYDQAVVFTARTCGSLCGAGSYVLLAKRHGVWTIKNQLGVWVS